MSEKMTLHKLPFFSLTEDSKVEIYEKKDKAQNEYLRVLLSPHCQKNVPYYWPAAAKLLQLCPTLCDPIEGSPPGSPIPGILQTRALE